MTHANWTPPTLGDLAEVLKTRYGEEAAREIIAEAVSRANAREAEMWARVAALQKTMLEQTTPLPWYLPGTLLPKEGSA